MTRPRPSQAITLLLVGLCFTVPATAFAWLFAQSSGNPNAWWTMIPFTAAFGTFITSLAVWLVRGRHAETVWNSTFVGAIIGVVAHPITATLSFFAFFFYEWWTRGSAALPANTWMGNIEDVGGGFLFVVFWWSLIAAVGFGWITMGIGAVAGFVFGLCHRMARHRFAKRFRGAVEASLAENDLAEQPEQFLRSAATPLWSSHAASCAALAIIVLMSIAMLLAFGDFSPPTTGVIFEKPGF